MHFDIISKVLVFSISDHSIQVSRKISFHDSDSLVVSGLKGVVYHGDFHYVPGKFPKRSGTHAQQVLELVGNVFGVMYFHISSTVQLLL